MTYTGALVLPNNAVSLSNDEMRYCEGGAKPSLKMLYRNIKGLWSYVPSAILKSMGITAFAGQILRHSLTWAYTIIAAKFGFLAAKVGGAVAGLVSFVGAGACGYYLATHRKFY